MSAAGTIWINLKANTKDFVSGLNRAHQRVRTVAASMSRQFKRVTSVVFSLKGAVLALAGTYGLAKLSQSFLEASKAAEGYGVRLNTLLGSQKEGNRLFAEMTAYATSVPFTYDEIMQSATALSGIMKGGVDEITKWMPMIGDLAAAAGLSIQDTTSQVIRMYSAGAASADLFRERGVLAMLGFTAGVKYSAEETKRMMFDAWTGVDSKFRGITKDLAKTWSGTMSMFSDQWFQFRLMVMDSGPFQSLKEGAQEALSWIQKMKSEGKLEEWARDVAVAILQSMQSVIKGIMKVKHAFHDVMIYWHAFKKNIYEEKLAIADATLGVFMSQLGGGYGRLKPEDEKEYLRLLKNVENYESLLKNSTDALNANIDATHDWDNALKDLIDRLEKMKTVQKDVNKETEKATRSGARKTGPTAMLDDDVFSLAAWEVDSIKQLRNIMGDVKEDSEDITTIWENTRDVIQNEIAGTLARAITRDFKSLGDVFSSLTTGLANMWGTMVAEMSMKWASSKLAKMFGDGAMATGGAMALIGAGIFAASTLFDGILGGDDDAMRMQKLREQAEELQDTIDSLTLEPLQYEIKQLNDAYGHQMNVARELRGNIDLVIEAREAEIKALRESATEMHTDLKTNVQDYLFSKQSKDFGVAQYSYIAAILTNRFNKLDKNSDTYQTDSIDILSDLFDVLKSIDSLNEEQLAASEKLIDAYNSSLQSIDDLAWELTNGTLAAVQSVSGFESKYQSLFEAALTGSSDAVQEFTNFIPTWLEYMKSYGGDYASIVSGVLGDLGIVRTSVEAAKNAEIVAMESLTGSLDANTGAVNALSAVIASNFTDLIDTATEAIDWQTFMGTLPTMPDVGGAIDLIPGNFGFEFYKVDPALANFLSLLSGNLTSENLPEGINMEEVNRFLSWYSAMPAGATSGIQDVSVIEEWLSQMPSLTLHGEPIVINTTIQVDGKTIATAVQEVAMENPEDYQNLVNA